MPRKLLPLQQPKIEKQCHYGDNRNENLRVKNRYELTASPTAPRPKIATDWPFLGFATFTVAPKPLFTITNKFIQHQLMKTRIYQILYKDMLKTCGNSAAKNADFVKRSSRIDLSQTAKMNNSVFTKSGGSNEMMNWLSIFGESGLAITDHNTTISIDSKKIAHIALFWFTMTTIATFTSENRKNMISWLKIFHAFSNTLNNTNQTDPKTKKSISQTKWFRIRIKIRTINPLLTLQLHVQKCEETKEFGPTKRKQNQKPNRCDTFLHHWLQIYLRFPEINIGVTKSCEKDLHSDFISLRRRHFHFLNH